MHTKVYQKCIFYLSVFGIAISVLVGFGDVIFGYLFELIHLLFEVVEMGLDNVIEHIFETDLHDTQLIVFYILLTIGAFLIYFVWKILVHICQGIGQIFRSEWSELKMALSSDWQGMSVVDRIIFIFVFLLINYLASFLLF